jgi:hypothetical protein
VAEARIRGLRIFTPAKSVSNLFMSAPSSWTFSAASQKWTKDERAWESFPSLLSAGGKFWDLLIQEGQYCCSIADEPATIKKFLVWLCGKRRFKLIDRHRELYYQGIIKG